MMKLRTPKLWLLTTAALIFGSQMSATAQTPLNYQSGAPTMVAAAPGFPSIPAEQIARDVTSEFNPRTGLRELVAAPFDPFEEDPTMAGSLRLRSAEGAIAIDGQPLRDGALVELDFYIMLVTPDLDLDLVIAILVQDMGIMVVVDPIVIGDIVGRAVLAEAHIVVC